MTLLHQPRHFPRGPLDDMPVQGSLLGENLLLSSPITGQVVGFSILGTCISLWCFTQVHTTSIKLRVKNNHLRLNSWVVFIYAFTVLAVGQKFKNDKALWSLS